MVIQPAGELVARLPLDRRTGVEETKKLGMLSIWSMQKQIFLGSLANVANGVNGRARLSR